VDWYQISSNIHIKHTYKVTQDKNLSSLRLNSSWVFQGNTKKHPFTFSDQDFCRFPDAEIQEVPFS